MPRRPHAGLAHATPELLPGSVDAAAWRDPPPRVWPASGAFTTAARLPQPGALRRPGRAA